jgi:hypothetical protein
MTSAEATNRLAIQELIDACAHCADRRDAPGQMTLFTEDTEFPVFMDSRSPEPSYDTHRREASCATTWPELHPPYLAALVQQGNALGAESQNSITCGQADLRGVCEIDCIRIS